MRWAELLAAVGDEPVFETGLLLAGDVDTADVRRQLSRWVEAGQLHRLRRGLYALAPPHERVRPHPFVVANRLVPGSYVSLQSALAHHGLIPEGVPVTTSVATSRPWQWDTPLGAFAFRHVHRSLLHGYRREELGSGQQAFVATPAKAVADLVHLVPGGDRREYLAELRIANLDGLDLSAGPSASPKVRRAFLRLAEILASESA